MSVYPGRRISEGVMLLKKMRRMKYFDGWRLQLNYCLELKLQTYVSRPGIHEAPRHQHIAALQPQL